MKIIAITQRLLAHTEYHEIREALSMQWGKLFNTGRAFSKYIPMPLSYEIDFHRYINAFKDLLAGVILSGGNDLSCCLDHKARNSLQGKLSFIRDEYETRLIEECIKHEIPLLGICRGAQMIAWHFGSEISKCNDHVGIHEISYTKHVLAQIAESRTNLTNSKLNETCNSFHNYCISKLNPNLIPLAICEDNSIEAFRHTRLAMFGIMWHIERNNGLEDNPVLKQWLNEINARS